MSGLADNLKICHTKRRISYGSYFQCCLEYIGIRCDSDIEAIDLKIVIVNSWDVDIHTQVLFIAIVFAINRSCGQLMNFRNQYIRESGRIAQGDVKCKSLGFQIPVVLFSVQREIMFKIFF